MSIPPIDEARALQVARRLFGVEGVEAKSLGSCQDANFRITPASGSTRYVLKVSCTIFGEEELQYQNDVIGHLNAAPEVAHLTFPRVMPLADGSGSCVGCVDLSGTPHLVRLLTYVEGALLADFKHYSSEASRGIGAFVATMHAAMGTCAATCRHKSQWDMRWAFENIMARLGTLPPSPDVDVLARTSAAMQGAVQSLSADLRSQLIHADLAPYNVIAQPDERGRPRVTGVIDFGDATSSWLVGDLVSALVPLLEGEERDPLSLAADVVAGYCAARPLLRAEVECLWPLVVLRASLLFVTVSHLLLSDPDNSYTREEVVSDRQILDRVLRVPLYAATHALLSAAGMAPAPQSSLALAPERVFAGKTACALDLSVFSPIHNAGNWLHVGSFEKELREHVQRELAGGGRALYVPSGAPVFYAGARPRSLREALSMPLGLTAFVPAGTRVFLDLSSAVGARADKIMHSSLPLVGARNNPFLLELLSSAGCSSHYFELGEGGAVVVVEGAVDVLRAAGGTVELSARPTGRSFETLHLQVLPAGLDVRSDDRNDQERYGLRHVPPAYCRASAAQLWRALCPPLFASAPPAEGVELAERYAHFAGVQEHYFRRPPVIERGYQQFLYGADGRAYLDMVNNVALVGHCNPAVAAAAAKQMNLLNTNSRFVYSVLGKFCAKIVSTIPQGAREHGKLNRVFLVNSGSEATDLAMRIARAVVTERRRKAKAGTTNLAGLGNALLLGLPGLLASAAGLGAKYNLSRDVICLAGGYHGVTTASDEVSTTLNDNPRSLDTRPIWIHLVPMPNLFRGLFRLPQGASEEEAAAAGRRYAELLEERVASMVASGCPPAAFICEPLSGNAGGVELPPGYLQRAYAAVRAAGGLCICDEVQVGYGRLGRCFWGFEEHGVVPDIVTMAKAAGNGHPLGFVITSQEIAEEFGADGSFFSSAGGGPVSCAVGLAVLLAVEEAGLQHNALEVGAYLRLRLLALQERHPARIGTVHGHGLYQGVELVRAGGEPATQEAYAVCERLLELGVLCHNTGDFSNVLKVKPPLCFGREDADFFVEALDIALQGW